MGILRAALVLRERRSAPGITGNRSKQSSSPGRCRSGNGPGARLRCRAPRRGLEPRPILLLQGQEILRELGRPVFSPRPLRKDDGVGGVACSPRRDGVVPDLESGGLLLRPRLRSANGIGKIDEAGEDLVPDLLERDDRPVLELDDVVAVLCLDNPAVLAHVEGARSFPELPDPRPLPPR